MNRWTLTEAEKATNRRGIAASRAALARSMCRHEHRTGVAQAVTAR